MPRRWNAFRGNFARVAETLIGHDLTVTFHAPFVDLSAGSTDPAIRAVTRRRFEQILDLAPLFTPRTVVAHAGYDWQRYEYFRKTWMEHSVEFWEWVADRLIREGSRLMLENVYEHRPNEIIELFQRLRPQGVGLCLDCGHQTAFGRAPLAEWLTFWDPSSASCTFTTTVGKKMTICPWAMVKSISVGFSPISGPNARASCHDPGGPPTR